MKHSFIIIFLCLGLIISSCEDDTNTNNNKVSNLCENFTCSENSKCVVENEQATCVCDKEYFIFNETNNLISVEFETGVFSEGWEFINENNGYMVWTGNPSMNSPSNHITKFKLNIKNPGTYLFLWNSSVTEGSSGSDHNDTWLRFSDATDFYGKKNESIVYPNGLGKTPNPNGKSVDGWFKVYRSGNDLSFKWQAKTSDNDAHNIYVQFDSPGIYTMEVSPRSTSHGIDKFVLFEDSSTSKDDAIAAKLSEISCE